MFLDINNIRGEWSCSLSRGILLSGRAGGWNLSLLDVQTDDLVEVDGAKTNFGKGR